MMLVNIEFHADILCQWCYVNKKSLEVAMERFRRKHPNVDFAVTWRPFFVTPQPNPNYGKQSFYEMRWGIEQFDGKIERIRAAAAKYGLTISLDGSTGSSRKCHQLSALALEQQHQQQGNTTNGEDQGSYPQMQSQLMDLFFKGQFEEGQDVTDEAWLEGACREVGLPADLIRETLQSDSAADEIDDMVARARLDDGVEAVPCVTVQGRFRVGGYQEDSVFERLFERIRAEGEVKKEEDANE